MQNFAGAMEGKAIHNSDELLHFAVGTSYRIHAADKIYDKELKGKQLKETQSKEDKIWINLQNDSVVDPKTFRDIAFKTIPSVIADGALKKGKYIKR